MRRYRLAELFALATVLLLSALPCFSTNTTAVKLDKRSWAMRDSKAVKANGPIVNPNACISEAALAKRLGRKVAAASGRRVHLLGLIPSSKKPGLYRGKKAPNAFARVQGSLPASKDLSASMPPVGDQGTQGACVAFSVGYYYKTFQEKREHGWSVAGQDHQFSPSFLYNQVAPFNEGATFDEIFNRLLDQGCATLADSPYIESDYTSWPSYTAFKNAIPYRIQSYTRLGNGLTSGIIDTMKARLAGGDLCVFGFPVFRPNSSTPGRFDLLTSTDYYYNLPLDADRYNAGGHALAIVGYDDAAFGGKGGFKVINSWGTGWGNAGFAYISYEFVMAFAFDIYVMVDRINYKPSSIAHFKFSHTYWGWDYDNVTIKIGVGTESSPAWSRTILSGLERGSLTVDMAVDISEAGHNPPSMTSNRWWVSATDSYPWDTGTMYIFDIENGGNTYSAAAALPFNTSVDARTFYSYVPSGEAASDNYYINDDSTTGDVYCAVAGDDSSDGLSASTPMRSLNALVGRYTLNGGDTVWVDSGSYPVSESVLIDYHDVGNPTSPILITGPPAPAKAVFNVASGIIGFDLFYSRYIALQDLTITGGTNGIRALEPYSHAFRRLAISGSSSDAIFLVGEYYGGAYAPSSMERCLVSSPGLACIAVAYTKATLAYCTLYGKSGATALRVDNHPHHYYVSYAGLSNSIVVAPSGICQTYPYSGAESKSQYNDLYAPGGSPGMSSPTDILLDPQFADSLSCDFHLKSQAGRWDPVSSVWVTDSVTSPCIDSGDPYASVGAEPSPNGSRVNQGIYGGTATASKSHPMRLLRIWTPGSGATCRTICDITWRVGGLGWTGTETVKLDYSANNGTDWSPITGAGNLPYNARGFRWDVRQLAAGNQYKLRITCNEYTEAAGDSGKFTISPLPGHNYYVNDSYDGVQDVYCTAAGSDANDGLAPGTPKSTIQSIIDTYALKPGDTVYVDTGFYNLTANIEVTAIDQGDSSAYVSFVGSTHPDRSVIDRGGTATTNSAFYLNDTDYVRISGFAIRNAYSGVKGYYAGSCQIDGNTISGTINGVQLTGNSVLANNLLLNNAYGMHLTGTSGGSGNVVVSNTFSGNASGGIYLNDYYQCKEIRNNIVLQSGSGYCINNAGGGAVRTSDYNCFYTTGTAFVGYLGSARATLAAWQMATGGDVHSIYADPLFADEVEGDWHLQSTGGRWDPEALSWVLDSESSPCIDAGDPADAVYQEPSPNGGRINMGAYGGTAEASKSPTGRRLVLHSPNGGEMWKGTQAISWSPIGQAWQPGNTLLLEYSTDSGSTWLAIDGASAVPYANLAFNWDTTVVPFSPRCRVRITCNQDAAVLDASDADFTIHNTGAAFYVNDAYDPATDAYCTASGNDANDGLYPSTPKATVQAVIDSYNLEPGDTVFIDTGTYTLTSDITVGDQDSGAEGSPVRFVGSTHPDGSLFSRNSATANAASWYLKACKYVTLARLRCTGATAGFGVRAVGTTGCSLDRSVCYGNKMGVDGEGKLTVGHSIFHGNSSYGIYNPSVALNNTCTGNGSGIYTTGGTVRNNILAVDGGGFRYCMAVQGTVPDSNYNDFWATNGAITVSQSGSNMTLSQWRSKSGKDSHSIAADPAFVDAANGDYHVKSTAGSWHGEAWTADAVDSPCLDRGGPADPVDDEPSPNGARINIGAYGGTAQASKSPGTRGIRLHYPTGGEVLRGMAIIRWETFGSGWTSGDLVTVDFSQNKGVSWVELNNVGVPYTDGMFSWATTTVTNGVHYRIRVSLKGSTTVRDASASDFAVRNLVNSGFAFYVNDSSTTNDVYCTAVGDDANDGFSPDKPKATLQNLIDTYDLEPGDTVYVDTGSYTLGADIVVGVQDSGNSALPLRFVGSTHPEGAILDRATSTVDASCIYLNGSNYVSIERFRCTGATNGYGIRSSANCAAERNVCYGNRYGISGGTVQHSICYNNSYYGLYAPSLAVNNTCLGNGKAAVYSSGGVLRGNILAADGTGKLCVELPVTTLPASDYNDYWPTNGAKVYKDSGVLKSLDEWRYSTGEDAHSLCLDPVFADAAAGDFHLRSTAGRYLASTNSWVTDAASSPCIDSGGPGDSFANEPLPNGNRINMGAYGGTAEASKSPAGRTLWLTSPTGGETWNSIRGISWVIQGAAWNANADKANIELSLDSGTSWQPLATSIPASARYWEWDTTTVANGTTYRVRVSTVELPGLSAASSSDFTINNTGTKYYVNDTETNGDQYCTATGDDANDGLSPSTPKAGIQAILDAYDLGPGDTIYVDSGTYMLSADIAVDPADSGDATALVRMEGVSGRTILDRQLAASSNCINVKGADYLRLSGMVLRNAAVGIRLGPGTRHCSVVECSFYGNTQNAVYVGSEGAYFIGIHNNNVLHSGTDNAIFLGCNVAYGGSMYCTVSNNTIVGTKGIGILARSGIVLQNNIVVASGADGYCLQVYDVRGITSDYNNYMALNGAFVVANLTYTNAVNKDCPTLEDWIAYTGQDIHSFSSDPMFANPATGDYHLLSEGGRYEPATGRKPTDPMAWVKDAVTSPCIDAGCPGDPPRQETLPNGGRINMGAYGGMLEASRSVDAVTREIVVLAPNGGEVWSGFRAIELETSGGGWAPGDTIKLEYSGDAGLAWHPVADANALPYTQQRFWWDTRTVTSGFGYLVRASCVQDPTVSDASNGLFRIANPGYGAWTLYVSPSGVDDLAHGSPANPFRTVAYALVRAEGTADALVNIRVAAGTYNERITMKPYVNLLGGYTDIDWSRDFAANECILDGGAGGSVVTGANNAVIDGFTITNGKAANGAGVYCYDNAPTISNNRIESNVATTSGGGIYCGYHVSPSVIDNVIAGNTAATGGGVFCNQNSPLIVGNTIVGNTAGLGGGLYYYYATPDAASNVIAFNSSGVHMYPSSGPKGPRYSDIFNPGGTDYSGGISPGAGSISADPKFVDKDAGDYHLASDSPCIDTGDDSVVQPDWVDMDGQMRIHGAHVDMGADERGVILTSITPNAAQNSGTISITDLTGEEFESGASVSLKKPGQVDVVATGVSVVSPTQITCTFDLTGKAIGAWNVVVTNPDGQWDKLGNGFTIFNGAPQNVNVTPSGGALNTGATTFSCLYSDPNGYMDIRKAYMAVNDSLAQTNAVLVVYDRLANKLYLKNDANTSWGTGYAPGTNFTLENSQCYFYVKDTTVSGSGTNLTVKWRVALKTAFVAKQLNAYMYVQDAGGSTDGWDKMGIYFGVKPQVVSIDPNDEPLPIEVKTTLTSLYRDVNGFLDLRKCYVLVCENFSQSNAVFLYYDKAANKVYLKNDANTSWGTGYAPGTDVTLENSQCVVYVKDIAVSGVGGDLTIVWSFKLKTAMTERNLYSWMYVTDSKGLYDGWRKMGTHFTPLPPVCVSVTPSSGNVQTGTPLVFTTEYGDDNGYTDIYQCYFQMGQTGSLANNVVVLYDTKQSKVFLRNDANTSWGTGYAPGTDVTLENNQCIVYVKNTTVTPSGSTDLIIDWNIQLKPILVPKLLGERMYCRDNEWLNSTWKLKGYVRAK